MNQAEYRVGDDCRIGGVEPARVFFPMIRRIGLIGLIRPISSRPNRAHFTRLRVVLVPLPLASLSQEILIVQQQLVQAGPRYIHQAQLCVAGGRSRSAALRDVLPAAARRLHHLIMGARTLIYKPVAERHCRIVNHRGHLEAAQLAVAAARSQPAWPVSRAARTVRSVRPARSVYGFVTHSSSLPPRMAFPHPTAISSFRSAVPASCPALTGVSCRGAAPTLRSPRPCPRAPRRWRFVRGRVALSPSCFGTCPAK